MKRTARLSTSRYLVDSASKLRARRNTEPVRPLKVLKRICGGLPELAAMQGLINAEEYLAVTNAEMH